MRPPIAPCLALAASLLCSHFLVAQAVQYNVESQIKAREAVKDYCALLTRHADDPNGETTLLTADLFENKENRVHNDLGSGPDKIGIQAYLTQMRRGNYQIAFSGQDQLKSAPFWTFYDTVSQVYDRLRHCLIYKVSKTINGRRHSNYFVVIAESAKIVNVFNYLPPGAQPYRSEPAVPAPATKKLFVNNLCEQAIELRIRYQDASGSWQTRAYWTFDEGARASLSYDNEALQLSNSTLYFHAKSTEGDCEWTGGHTYGGYGMMRTTLAADASGYELELTCPGGCDTEETEQTAAAPAIADENKSKATYTLRAADVKMKGGTITKYTGTNKSIVIPERINGVAVTSIGEEAFFSSQLTSVTLPNSVTSIGDWAFWKNQLTSVTLPNSVTSIGDYAFFSNQLPRVTIGNSVTSIGRNAFNNNAIAQVNGAPSNGIIYAQNADGTEDRTAIVSYGGTAKVIDFIPNRVTRIGHGAFLSNQLTHVTLPNSITSIGAMAFNDNAIAQVNGLNSNGIIYARNADGTDNRTAIASYGGTAKVVDFIPNSVTRIGEGAFSYNQLTSVTIPKSVTRIGEGAFQRNQLISVTIGNSVTSIGRNAFNNNAIAQVNGAPSNGIIYARNADGTEDRTAIVSYGGTAKVIDFIPNRVTRIGHGAFLSNQLTHVTLPNSVTRIGWGAFSFNHNLSSRLPTPAHPDKVWRDEDGNYYKPGSTIADFDRAYTLTDRP